MPQIDNTRSAPVQPAFVPASNAVTPGSSAPQQPAMGQLGGQAVSSQTPGPLPQAADARPAPRGGPAIGQRPLTDAAPSLPVRRQPIAAQVRLDADLASGQRIPASATRAEALAFASQGISLQVMGELLDLGFGPDQAGAAAQFLRDKVQAAEIVRSEFKTAGFNDQEIRLMQSAQMTPEEAKAYQASGTGINAHTLPQGRVDRGNQLGAGAISTVYEAHLVQRGQVTSGVIKALNKADPHFAGEVSGIDPKNANTAARNLAALDLAKMLGFDVIVDTKIILAGPRGEPKTPHLFMARAEGGDADHAPSSHFDNPAVRREATKLQLLDCLIGAIDRTPANYFIEVRADGSVKVTGIDNDQCFGQWLTHPDQIKGSKDELPGSMDDKGKPNTRKSFRGTPMPEVIDKDMKAALLALTEASVRPLLLGLGLTEPEVAATLQRLATMQTLIKDPVKTTVIDAGGWNNPQNLTSVNAGNSLFASGKAWVDGGRESVRQEAFVGQIDEAILDETFGGEAVKNAAGAYGALTGDQQRSQCRVQVRLAVASNAMALVDQHFIGWLRKAAVPASQVDAYRASVAEAFDRAARDEKDGLNVFVDLMSKAKQDSLSLRTAAKKLAAMAAPQSPAQSAQ